MGALFSKDCVYSARCCLRGMPQHLHCGLDVHSTCIDYHESRRVVSTWAAIPPAAQKITVQARSFPISLGNPDRPAPVFPDAPRRASGAEAVEASPPTAGVNSGSQVPGLSVVSYIIPQRNSHCLAPALPSPRSERHSPRAEGRSCKVRLPAGSQGMLGSA